MVRPWPYLPFATGLCDDRIMARLLTVCSNISVGTPPSLPSAGGVNRPRSKTFEEYEKETNDVWDDKEEDLESLTHSLELEMVPENVEGGVEGRVRNNSRGKGRGGLVCMCEGGGGG